MQLKKVFGIGLAALCMAPLACAHDFWIEPENFQPSVDENVPIVLRVGEDFTGTSQPLIPQWFSDYTVTGPDGREPVRGMIGDDPAGSFTPSASGTWVVGYRSTRAFVEMEPEKFNTYLDKEGLEWVRTRREATGDAESTARELYSRCAKSLVQVGDAPSGGFDTKLGYRLELIPEADPQLLEPGDKLSVQLLYEDAPLADILIVAFTAENPTEQQKTRTDTDGRATITLGERGTWLIKGVHIIELPDTETRADWESFWASLTFAI